MDCAASMGRPRWPMVLGHHSACTDCTDARLDQLSLVYAISHGDFETKPDEEWDENQNWLIQWKWNRRNWIAQINSLGRSDIKRWCSVCCNFVALYCTAVANGQWSSVLNVVQTFLSHFRNGIEDICRMAFVKQKNTQKVREMKWWNDTVTTQHTHNTADGYAANSKWRLIRR